MLSATVAIVAASVAQAQQDPIEVGLPGNTNLFALPATTVFSPASLAQGGFVSDERPTYLSSYVTATANLVSSDPASPMRLEKNFSVKTTYRFRVESQLANDLPAGHVVKCTLTFMESSASGAHAEASIQDASSFPTFAGSVAQCRGTAGVKGKYAGPTRDTGMLDVSGVQSTEHFEISDPGGLWYSSSVIQLPRTPEHPRPVSSICDGTPKASTSERGS